MNIHSPPAGGHFFCFIFKHDQTLSFNSRFITSLAGAAQIQPLKISVSGRFFITADGKPFFWLGDTGWLLFLKCTRQDAIEYLDTRKAQGFNVIQVMAVHDLKQDKNVYGDSAFINQDISAPKITPGNAFSNEEEYDYWDHAEFIIDEAATTGY